MKIERTSNKHLGELLIERGIIDPEQLEKALEYQRNNKGFLLGEVLVQLSFAIEEDIARF